MSLSIVILAAGQGTRMRSRLPKVLHRVGDATMLERVLATARELHPETICVVYGHGGEQVPRSVEATDVAFVRQEPQLGTGDALRTALREIGTSEMVLVLYGDVPLIGEETLGAMIAGGGDRLTLLTAELANPGGYGRIIRSKRGSITAIVEEKDATPEQRKLREINTGIMALPTGRLADWTSKLSNRNAQREYYLTDVVPLAVADKVAVGSVKAGAEWEILTALDAALLKSARVIMGELHGRRDFELLAFLQPAFHIGAKKQLRSRLFNFFAVNRDIG